MCSDSVGGYDCVCKSGFSGVHCEKGEARTAMPPLLIHVLFWFVCVCVCATNFTSCFHDADETVCTLEKNKGCTQFCKPGYTSYECSCAWGWRLSTQDRNKCEPAGTSASRFHLQLNDSISMQVLTFFTCNYTKKEILYFIIFGFIVVSHSSSKSFCH